MNELKQIDVAEFVKPERKKRVKKQKTTFKRKFLRFLTVLTIIAIGVAYAIEGYAGWRAGHQWQFPTRWIGFVKEVEPKAYAEGLPETKPLTDIEVIEQYHLSPALKTIYFLESTSGKNDFCKESGKFNGYGYRQNSFEKKCYDTFEQVTDKVNEWLEDRLATNGNNLVEAICFYNKGIQGLEVCDYSINFMGVLTKNF
jgi:hypothetical protein